MLRPATYQPCSVQGVFSGVKPRGICNLEAGFPLRCLQRLSLPNDSYPALTLGRITGTPEVRPLRSSRTKSSSSHISNAHSR